MFCKMCILLFFLLCCLTNGTSLPPLMTSLLKERADKKELKKIMEIQLNMKEVENLVKILEDDVKRILLTEKISTPTSVSRKHRANKVSDQPKLGVLANEKRRCDANSLTTDYCNDLNEEIKTHKDMLDECLRMSTDEEMLDKDRKTEWFIDHSEWVYRTAVTDRSNRMKQNYLREYLTADEADKPKWIHFIEILLQIVDTVNLKDSPKTPDNSARTYDETLIEALDFKATIDPNWTSEDISSRRRRFQDVYRKYSRKIEYNIRRSVNEALDYAEKLQKTTSRRSQAAESKKKTREIKMSLETMLRFVDNEESNSRSVAKAALDLIKLSAKVQKLTRDTAGPREFARLTYGMFSIDNPEDEKIRHLTVQYNMLVVNQFFACLIEFFKYHLVPIKKNPKYVFTKYESELKRVKRFNRVQQTSNLDADIFDAFTDPMKLLIMRLEKTETYPEVWDDLTTNFKKDIRALVQETAGGWETGRPWQKADDYVDKYVYIYVKVS
eukprot:GHVL01005076.1.p1 GENE.GHVL01005076.1~~GHVL01005076.1.p1  ORF type:complete len:498 (+),score=66.23 GHVL01005076.1:25-1518(+)